jgi:hypothetical protein
VIHGLSSDIEVSSLVPTNVFGSKESTLKGRGLHLPPKMGLSIENIGFLISNAKAQMSNECQSPKSKNVIGLTLKNRNTSCFVRD